MMDSISHIPSKQAVDVFFAQRARLDAQGGIAQGYHGTSASSARQIQHGGFRNSQPSRISQASGVYFTDGLDSASFEGAKAYAINRALWRNERDYAVIRAKFRSPQPDLLTGVPQWVVSAHNILDYSVEFFAVPEHIQPTTAMKLWHWFSSRFSSFFSS